MRVLGYRTVLDLQIQRATRGPGSWVSRGGRVESMALGGLVTRLPAFLKYLLSVQGAG